MKTTIYVDGYNLYYGRLAGTAYKWLDLVELFREIVRVQDPSCIVDQVKFFTAPALANFSRHGQTSVTAQQHYHRALQSRHPELVTIIMGRHEFTQEWAPAVRQGQPPSKDDRVQVWKVVEKKTDVNLAIEMYRDASKDSMGQLVLCSNDSDAEPALKAISEDFPEIKIGIVTPRRPPATTEKGADSRVVSRSLANLASWTRHSIRDEELKAAQLPENVVSPAGKVFKRPTHWHAP